MSDSAQVSFGLRGQLRIFMRGAALVAWGLAGLVFLYTVFRVLNPSARERVVSSWSAGLLAICGLGLRVSGHVRQTGPVFLLANHVSWLDIFALNASRGVMFVAKAEIRDWPIVGALVRGCGTIFIERGSRHAVRHVNRQITAALDNGRAVAVFPEGTTTYGDQLLAFHANLVDAALAASAPIQAVALRYCQANRFDPRCGYVGDQSLLDNLKLVLARPDLTVNVHWIDVWNGRDWEDAAMRGSPISTAANAGLSTVGPQDRTAAVESAPASAKAMQVHDRAAAPDVGSQASEWPSRRGLRQAISRACFSAIAERLGIHQAPLASGAKPFESATSPHSKQGR